MLEYASRNWLRLLLASRGSVSPGVPRRVAAFTSIAVLLLFYDRFYRFNLRLPIGLHEVAGAVIALVLAFRVNNAYARFWEGRTLWGGLVNAARNTVRVIRGHARDGEANHRAFATWAVVFAHATRCRVRGEPVAPEVAAILEADAVAKLTASVHPPLHAAQQLSGHLQRLLGEGAIDPILAGRAERHIASLVDALGGIERIRKTPTPLGIVLVIERFVALYLTSLPFALLGPAGLWTPVLTAAISYPVLMIDALGSELDDPFGHHLNDLPLTRICRSLEWELLGQTPVPAPVEPIEVQLVD